MEDALIRQIRQRAREDEEFQRQLRSAPRQALREYPLAEATVRRFILPNFSWVIEHRLAGLGRPGTEDALALLRDLGVTRLITLTEQPLPPALLIQHQLPADHWPIPDYTAPSLTQAGQIVARIQELLNQGQVVGVHCGAGLGRTGTILACYLVAGGLPAAAAMAAIRARRPGSIETEAQEALVEAYAQRRPD